MVPQEKGNGYHEEKVSLVGMYVSVWAEEVVRSACGVDGDLRKTLASYIPVHE
jgi:hypothetical protein